ncbi:MAG: UDP-N-acetylmuramoyl-tripeptide--D-alanyl-D-alanine ligase, partial [Gaiellaceae bacterium]|nr:UDP-N-acetylmuramoyl-tripeptide--D-alanyl-D-alanine ligase [Gaiellaceae bacterium]
MSLARAALGRGRELPDAVARSALLSLTRARRRRLRETTFIAVTGSAGKTTTCRLLAAALAPGGETVLTLGRWNQTRQLARAVRGAGRARFCVLELQAFAPGSLDARLRAYEPDVGVVTTVGADHLSRFGSRSAVAEEKSKLVAALPPTGVAVLNADDAEVRSMAELSRARVVLFGRSPDAEFRAEDVRAAFPDRLAFTLVTGGRSVAVQTRLCGEVWIPAVLGAVATAATLGVGLERVVEAIALVEPSPFRLAPVVAPSGITFLRDDWKASAWTVRPALETLASAAGRRRIAVLGGISDDRR